MPSAKKCAEKYKKGSKEYKACRAYRTVKSVAEFAVPGLAAARGISNLATKKSKSSKVRKKSKSTKGRMY